MNNGDLIRSLFDIELLDICKYEICFPQFVPDEIRSFDNRILSVLLSGCCNHCLYSDCDFIYCGECTRSIFEYLNKEVLEVKNDS